MSRLSVFLAFSALACFTVAQSTTNTTTQPQAPPAQQPTVDPTGSLAGSLSQPMAQQAIMTYVSSLFLEWQSANAWASCLGYLNRLNVMKRDDVDDYHYGAFEEQGEDQLGLENPQAEALETQEEKDYPDMSKEERLEFLAETAMSSALKIMHLEAAAKLAFAQIKHTQSQMAVATIAASNIGQAQGASYLLMLMYYRSVLDSVGSMATIVRHDSWTMWNHQEMTETVVFKTADGMTPTFSSTLDRCKKNAVMAWNMETSIDIQSLFVDLYLSSAAGSLVGGSAPGTSSVFLEEEAQAEPAQAQQSVGSMSPQVAAYWQYALQWMTLYSRWMEHSASQSFATIEMLEDNTHIEFGKREEYASFLKKSGLVSWTHWAQVKQFLAYYNLFFLWYGTGGFGSMAGPNGGSLGAMLGGSMGGPAGSLLGGSLGSSLGNAAVVGSALGGSMYGPYGSMLGGSLGSSL